MELKVVIFIIQILSIFIATSADTTDSNEKNYKLSEEEYTEIIKRITDLESHYRVYERDKLTCRGYYIALLEVKNENSQLKQGITQIKSEYNVLKHEVANVLKQQGTRSVLEDIKEAIYNTSQRHESYHSIVDTQRALEGNFQHLDNKVTKLQGEIQNLTLLDLSSVYGQKGEKGDTGAEGIRGERGLPGVQGAKGESGVKGTKGARGEPGLRAEKGERGLTGFKGSKGARGERGIQGTKGEKGDRPGCPSGWILHSNSCYLISTAQKNWLDSQAYCRTVGAYLIEIQSRAENDFIKNYLKSKKNNGMLWIGGTDRQTENAFIWMNSGTRFAFTDWKPGEPNNSDNIEDCVEIAFKMKGWNDDSCRKQKSFICEKNLS